MDRALDSNDSFSGGVAAIDENSLTKFDKTLEEREREREKQTQQNAVVSTGSLRGRKLDKIHRNF